MIRRFLPTVVVTEGPSQGWGDLFDVRPLLKHTWNYLDAEAEWERLLPGFTGRRVVVVGRALSVIDWNMPKLPPMRWLQLGRAGEPAEVMWLPGPVDPWRNNPDNRALVDAWLAEERKRADKIAHAWCSIPNTEYRYSFVRGEFGTRHDSLTSHTTWGVVPWDCMVLQRALTRHVHGVNRWGGGGWDDLRHSLLVRAALPPGANGTCRRKALTHDHHEHLVSDLSTPLKGIIGDAWREVEQGAEAAVEGVFKLDGLTPEDRAAVKVADQVALRIEARALGFGHLGDPAELHPVPGRLEWVQNCLRALPDSQVVDTWWSAWRDDGG